MKTRSLRFLLTSLLTLGLFVGLGATATAQDNEEQENKEEQEDKESSVETLEVDPVHSNVLFRIKHLDTGYVFGEFLGEEGTIKFDPDDPEKMEVNLTMPIESINTDNEQRDTHLKSADFFHAKQFPNMTFESTEVEEAGQDKYEVTGDLTIKGETEKVTTTVEQVGNGKDQEGNFRRGFYTEFTVDRSDFGIDFMEDALSDEVKIIIAVEGVRQ